MKSLLLVVAAFAILQVVSKATALTNEEFFKTVKDYATDIEPYDLDEDDSDAVETNDVITLPGGPDDDVDFEYLLSSMNFNVTAAAKEFASARATLWWDTHHHHHHRRSPRTSLWWDTHHHHHHPNPKSSRTSLWWDTHHHHHHRRSPRTSLWWDTHHHHHHRESPRTSLWWDTHHHHHHRVQQDNANTMVCTCSSNACTCGFSNYFRVYLHSKKIHFRVNPRLTIAYLKNQGFELTADINDHHLYTKTISLTHPPTLCSEIPSLVSSEVCIQLHSLDVTNKQVCGRLTGSLPFMFRTFRANLNLGCFRIPFADKDVLLSVLNDPDFLKIQPIDDEEPTDVTFSDVIDNIRSLQNDNGDLESNEDY